MIIFPTLASVVGSNDQEGLSSTIFLSACPLTPRHLSVPIPSFVKISAFSWSTLSIRDVPAL